MRRRALLVGAVMLSLAAAAAAQGRVRIDTPTTKEGFAQGITRNDDALDTSAKFDTAAAHPYRPPPAGVTLLRAWVDKRTGATTFQVYARITYDSPWRNYRTAAYTTDQGPTDTRLTQIASDVGTCTYRCNLSEVFGFDVPEAVMRGIAAKYSADPTGAWEYKFTALDGAQWHTWTLYAEMAALIEAIDAYRNAHPTRGQPDK